MARAQKRTSAALASESLLPGKGSKPHEQGRRRPYLRDRVGGRLGPRTLGGCAGGWQPPHACVQSSSWLVHAATCMPLGLPMGPLPHTHAHTQRHTPGPNPGWCRLCPGCDAAGTRRSSRRRPQTPAPGPPCPAAAPAPSAPCTRTASQPAVPRLSGSLRDASGCLTLHAPLPGQPEQCPLQLSKEELGLAWRGSKALAFEVWGSLSCSAQWPHPVMRVAPCIARVSMELHPLSSPHQIMKVAPCIAHVSMELHPLSSPSAGGSSVCMACYLLGRALAGTTKAHCPDSVESVAAGLLGCGGAGSPPMQLACMAPAWMQQVHEVLRSGRLLPVELEPDGAVQLQARGRKHPQGGKAPPAQQNQPEVGLQEHSVVTACSWLQRA